MSRKKPNAQNRRNVRPQRSAGDLRAQYTNGITTMEVRGSESLLVAWDDEVRAIKAAIAQINESERVGLIDERIQEQLYHIWIKRVLKFRDGFGDERVPDDIKWACNNVQMNIGVEQTKWIIPYQEGVFGK